jgi:predicted transcriptional regulator
MFPVVIDKLRHLEEIIINESVTKYQMDNFVEFIGALEAVVHIAGTNNSKQAKFSLTQPGLEPMIWRRAS